jgi:hypothetical protein
VAENHQRGAAEPAGTRAASKFFNEFHDGMRLALQSFVRRTRNMKSKLFIMALLVAGSLCAETHFSIGVGIGLPGYYPPPPPVVAYAPAPYPGPGYTWVGGYWYPYGGRYAWRAGYWAAPPFAGAYWVAPRYYGGAYYRGYWGHHDRGWHGDRDGRWGRR